MVRAAYLRVALTYMLISMPHGTSTIFGAFQAILALLANGTNFTPSRINYRLMKSSPVNSFAVKPRRALLRCSNAPTRPGVGRSRQRAIKGFMPFRLGNECDGTWPSDVTEINNL